MMNMTIERLIEILQKADENNECAFATFIEYGEKDNWDAKNIDLGYEEEWSRGFDAAIQAILVGIKNNQQPDQFVGALTIELEYPN